MVQHAIPRYKVFRGPLTEHVGSALCCHLKSQQYLLLSLISRYGGCKLKSRSGQVYDSHDEQATQQQPNAQGRYLEFSKRAQRKGGGGGEEERSLWAKTIPISQRS